MIKSMTGYGRAKTSAAGFEITVELRSVNHRYFDCSIRIPRVYVSMEEPIKARVQKYIVRGKVDVFVTLEPLEDAKIALKFNNHVAEAYISALRTMKQRYSLEDDIDLMGLARLPEVFAVASREVDEGALLSEISAVLEEALFSHNEMRVKEGENLKADILARTGEIERLLQVVEMRSPQILVEYREKLYAKLQELLADKNIDDSRILTEAALYADRVAVDEETVRLRSHIGQLRTMLEKGGDVGRKLDFLVQEFNREINTIGSKANHAEIGKIVVDLKSEVEKIREQVQNIE